MSYGDILLLVICSRKNVESEPLCEVDLGKIRFEVKASNHTVFHD